uniref:Uncharacterized protein n=1 Tax=Anguilla anguilla TaxID=7936 RepID=A0A0E9XXG1_ANGAN
MEWLDFLTCTNFVILFHLSNHHKHQKKKMYDSVPKLPIFMEMGLNTKLVLSTKMTANYHSP